MLSLEAAWANGAADLRNLGKHPKLRSIFIKLTECSGQAFEMLLGARKLRTLRVKQLFDAEVSAGLIDSNYLCQC